MILFKMKSLGETIRDKREEKQLPLRTVAAYLDIDQAILSKIERGQRHASRDQVIKLAEFFTIKESDLLVSWLSDKLMYLLADEVIAIEALHMAEEKVSYQLSQKADINQIIGEMHQVFRKFIAVRKAWMFGSFSRKEEHFFSDMDILIDVPDNERFTLFDIAELKEQIQNLINREADVVMLSAIKPHVKQRIASDLKLIYEA